MPVHGPLSPGQKRSDLGLFPASFYKKQEKRVKNGKKDRLFFIVMSENVSEKVLFPGKSCCRYPAARIFQKLKKMLAFKKEAVL
jgi:hypothetical protein